MQTATIGQDFTINKEARFVYFNIIIQGTSTQKRLRAILPVFDLRGPNSYKPISSLIFKFFLEENTNFRLTVTTNTSEGSSDTTTTQLFTTETDLFSKSLDNKFYLIEWSSVSTGSTSISYNFCTDGINPNSGGIYDTANRFEEVEKSFFDLALTNAIFSNADPSRYDFFIRWLTVFVFFPKPASNYYHSFNNTTLNSVIPFLESNSLVNVIVGDQSSIPVFDFVSINGVIILPISPYQSIKISDDPNMYDLKIISNAFNITYMTESGTTDYLQTDDAPLNANAGTLLSKYKYRGTVGFPIIQTITQTTPQPTTVPCLLKGTLILTPSGYKTIESLNQEDLILNHDKQVLPIKKISKITIRWSENLADDEKIYKIIGEEPIYITGYHKIRLPDGSFEEAHNCWLPYAKKEEFVQEDGTYEVYNIHLDDWENNHLIVNDGIIVESWSGL